LSCGSALSSETDFRTRLTAACCFEDSGAQAESGQTERFYRPDKHLLSA